MSDQGQAHSTDQEAATRQFDLAADPMGLAEALRVLLKTRAERLRGPG